MLDARFLHRFVTLSAGNRSQSPGLGLLTFKTKKMRKTPRHGLKKHPRQQRSLQTVEFILQAATYILEREGNHRATTNRIAERAGVNIASLYQYFDDKDAILQTLVLSRAEQELSLLEQHIGAFAQADVAQLAKVIAHRICAGINEAPQALRQMVLMTPQLGQVEKIKTLRLKATDLIALELTRRRSISLPVARQSAFVLLHTVLGVIHGYLYTNTADISCADLEGIIESLIVLQVNLAGG